MPARMPSRLPGQTTELRCWAGGCQVTCGSVHIRQDCERQSSVSGRPVPKRPQAAERPSLACLNSPGACLPSERNWRADHGRTLLTGHEMICRPDFRMRHRRTLDGAPRLPCGSGSDVNAGYKRRACRTQGMAGGKKHGEEVCLPETLFVLPLCQETSVPGNAAGFRQGKEHPCRSLCLPLLPVMYASALSGRPGG